MKLACIGTCYLPTGEVRGKGGDKVRVLKKYEDQTYPSDPKGDIYEFEDDALAKIVIESGHFVPVE